ncbi:LOW QUALITY PROTEIN: syntaxin-binding protein 4 [Bufo bufo]|uniref:LOW QUALITY PROTEIN: syntaxin-binding protein 4 n=1 Tax=Bufo bufo TaxID=8384 RepID=UPI001ABEE4F2|nr:LOW QUALITY PROTEIN: syntaxin-binding protein 4 [Bufo bufo]
MADAVDISEDTIQIIAVKRETGLGLSLMKGVSTTEGPLIQIKHLIPGGDCHKDGRLRPGDQLLSVNKEPLVGVSCQEAKSILNRVKLRHSVSNKLTDCKDVFLHQTPLACDLPSHSGCITERRTVAPADGSRSDVCVSVPLHGRNLQRPISLTSGVRLKVEKLEMALGYLGITLTEGTEAADRSHMDLDAHQTVCFGDFVQAAKEMLKLQLEDSDFGPYIMTDDSDDTRSVDDVTSQARSINLSDADDLNHLRRDKDELYDQIRILQEQLLESERRNSQLSAELCNVQKEAKAAIDETRALRNRIHLAEVAQKQARGMEVDYEEVIRLLEAEVMELKAQLSDHSGPAHDCIQDLKRRITVLDCQLRKSETARKAFEMSTLKLLQFVENTQEVLVDNSGSTLSLCDHAPMLASQVKTLGKNRLGVMAALAAEAKELSVFVRSLIEADCLPYGWEEAYTADGIKYFINHVTEATSWTHPVISALNQSSLEDEAEDSPRDFLELASC